MSVLLEEARYDVESDRDIGSYTYNIMLIWAWECKQNEQAWNENVVCGENASMSKK